MARPHILELSLILLLLSHAIGNPLANLLGFAFKVFRNPTTSQHLYCYTLVQATFNSLLAYYISFLIDISTPPLFHVEVANSSIRPSGILFISLVGEPFPQLLWAHQGELHLGNGSYHTWKCLEFTLSIPFPRVFTQ